MKHRTALCMILAITAVLGFGICILADNKGKLENKFSNLADAIRNASHSAKNDNSEEKSVVTSFYPIYIMSLNLMDGVEGISLTNLAENQTGCLHDYQLTTENMRLLEDASLFIVNGGGMEGFLEDMAKNYENLEIIYCNKEILSEDIVLPSHNDEDISEHEHEENAHYWMNPDLYIKQVEYLAKMLSMWDPVHSTQYEENKNIYCDKIKKLSDRMDNELLELAGTHIISFHEAFHYLADKLSIKTDYTLDLDGETYLGAGEIADILEKAENSGISFLWAESSTKQSLLSLILKEGNGKTLVLDALIDGENDKNAYINGMEKNIETLRTCIAHD